LVSWSTSCSTDGNNQVDLGDSVFDNVFGLRADSFYFKLSTVATYKLCYRATGGTDLIAQSKLIMTVIDPSSHIRITSISPKTVTQNFHTAITLTGSVKQGDLVSWSTSCSTNGNNQVDLGDPVIDIILGLRADSFYFKLSTVVTYKLCYRATGCTDLVALSKLMMTAIDPTSHIRITSISPKTVTQNFHTAITLTGSVKQGDLVSWSTSCSTNGNNQVDLGDSVFDIVLGLRADSFYFKLSTLVTYKLCYRATEALTWLRRVS